MPIIKSAKKAARQNLDNRARNVVTKRLLKNANKSLANAIKEGDAKESANLLSNVYKLIDTAAKKNVIPKNRASRMKSKAARAVASVK